ncbi:MAG: hypothetical protein KC535_05805 [Nanoarchaeota archaeon]|nr:hypothetical protein [Nanoarchaeota archaeon]
MVERLKRMTLEMASYTPVGARVYFSPARKRKKRILQEVNKNAREDALLLPGDECTIEEVLMYNEQGELIGQYVSHEEGNLLEDKSVEDDYIDTIFFKVNGNPEKIPFFRFKTPRMYGKASIDMLCEDEEYANDFLLDFEFADLRLDQYIAHLEWQIKVHELPDEKLIRDMYRENIEVYRYFMDVLGEDLYEGAHLLLESNRVPFEMVKKWAEDYALEDDLSNTVSLAYDRAKQSFKNELVHKHRTIDEHIAYLQEQKDQHKMKNETTFVKIYQDSITIYETIRDFFKVTEYYSAHTIIRGGHIDPKTIEEWQKFYSLSMDLSKSIEICYNNYVSFGDLDEK